MTGPATEKVVTEFGSSSWYSVVAAVGYTFNCRCMLNVNHILNNDNK